MKKVITSMALAVLCTAGLTAQTGTTGTRTTGETGKQETKRAHAGGDQHCLAQADDQTWSNLGLTEDQIRRVNEIKKKHKEAKHHDRGTENTMRGTQDDRATPAPGTTGTTRTGTTDGTDRSTGTDRATGTTGTGTQDRAATGTQGTTGTERGHTGSTRTSDQLGYDDTHKEAMERELRTVLTTAQFERYQEWCEEMDTTRGDRDTDMDR